MRDAVKTTEATVGKINSRYDLSISEAREIFELLDRSAYDAIITAFRYRYAMGTRATKAEQAKSNQ